MKTKKITFFTFFVFLSAGIVLFFTGCEQDYYDPSRQQGTGSSLFGDSIDVPATFDWATTSGHSDKDWYMHPDQTFIYDK